MSLFVKFVGGTAPTPAVCKCLLGSHLRIFYPFNSTFGVALAVTEPAPFHPFHIFEALVADVVKAKPKKPRVFPLFFGVPLSSGHGGGDLPFHSLEIGSLCAEICGGKTS